MDGEKSCYSNRSEAEERALRNSTRKVRRFPDALRLLGMTGNL